MSELLYKFDAVDYPEGETESDTLELLRGLEIVSTALHHRNEMPGRRTCDDTLGAAAWKFRLEELTDGLTVHHATPEGHRQVASPMYRMLLIKIITLGMAALQSWDRQQAKQEPEASDA